MKKTTKYTTLCMPLGMCFGVAIGTAIDSIGLSMGLCLGMAAGLAIGMVMDRKINDQLETKGYTVKSIEPDEADGSSRITLTDKDGAEQTVTIPADTMKSERFKVGDAVYLDENGRLQQAFNEDEIW